jgi:Peroxidase
VLCFLLPLLQLAAGLLRRRQLLTPVSAQDVEDWPKRAGSNGSLRFPKECAHGCNAGEQLQQPPCVENPMQNCRPSCPQVGMALLATAADRNRPCKSVCEAWLLHADWVLLHAGLVSAVEMLQPIKDQVPNVSWADLMQMASALAVEDAGGPKIDMRYGREDCPTEDLKAADGVLPGEGSCGLGLRLECVLRCVAQAHIRATLTFSFAGPYASAGLQPCIRLHLLSNTRCACLALVVVVLLNPAGVAPCSGRSAVAQQRHLAGRAPARGLLPAGLQRPGVPCGAEQMTTARSC